MQAPSWTSRIPTRTERQAMDWSLVLASQGIETTIEQDPDAGTWQLLVNGTDYARARQSIRQYLQENRGRRWCQELPLPGLILDWRSLLPMMVLILIYAAVSTDARVKAAGIMSTDAVQAGEWWRLFTAVSLHADLTHLTANVTTGFLFLGLAMGAFGSGLGLLGPFLAGVAGNLAGFWTYGVHHHSLGASGMILGALGLVTAHSLLLFRHGLAAGSFFVRALVSGCLLLILVGLNPQPNVDLVAHVAGFGAGLGMGALLSLRPRWFLISDPPPSFPEQFPNSAGGSVANWSGPTVGQPRPWLDRAALSVFLLLFALPWGQALHSVAIPALALLGCTVIITRPRQAASSGSRQSPAQPSQTGPATQNPPSPADGTKPDSAGRPDV